MRCYLAALEEIQQTIWGKSLPQESLIGSCWLHKPYTAGQEHSWTLTALCGFSTALSSWVQGRHQCSARIFFPAEPETGPGCFPSWSPGEPHQDH